MIKNSRLLRILKKLIPRYYKDLWQNHKIICKKIEKQVLKHKYV